MRNSVPSSNSNGADTLFHRQPKTRGNMHIPFPGWKERQRAGNRAGMRRTREKYPTGARMGLQLWKALKKATALQLLSCTVTTAPLLPTASHPSTFPPHSAHLRPQPSSSPSPIPSELQLPSHGLLHPKLLIMHDQHVLHREERGMHIG